MYYKMHLYRPIVYRPIVSVCLEIIIFFFPSVRNYHHRLPTHRRSTHMNFSDNPIFKSKILALRNIFDKRISLRIKTQNVEGLMIQDSTAFAGAPHPDILRGNSFFACLCMLFRINSLAPLWLQN